MKIKSKEYEIGETRTKVRFAFLPTRVDKENVIWLEKYLSTEKYDFWGTSYPPTLGWGEIEVMRLKNED